MLEIFVCYKFSYVYMLENFQRGTSATLENNKYNKKKKKNPCTIIWPKNTVIPLLRRERNVNGKGPSYEYPKS